MFGVYDPEQAFGDDDLLEIRHLYVSWQHLDDAAFVERLDSLREQRRIAVLLTVEPWPQEGSEASLLQDIVSGQYDEEIDQLAALLQRQAGRTYLSWGHEMDQDLTERYPWSGKDPEQYKTAYRYVVDRLREKTDTELRWIWAGVLKQGSLRYWPGDEYVDVIGMPIYSFPEWDRQVYGYIRDFQSTFEEKLSVVASVEKPVMITELGVCGSDDFESFWLRQAFLSLADYPRLAGIVFFYSRDTEGAWGDAVSTPDWRVHPELIRGLVDWKRQSVAAEKP
jgi:beta-mannanase